VSFPLKLVIFYSYVSLPEGKVWQEDMDMEETTSYWWFLDSIVTIQG